MYGTSLRVGIQLDDFQTHPPSMKGKADLLHSNSTVWQERWR